jgi:hypothetical protein
MGSWLLIAGSAAAACSSELPDVGPPRSSRDIEIVVVRAGMFAYVQRFTGHTPLDCGQYVLTQAFARADAEDLRRSVACAAEAAGRRQAFVTFEQSQGIDSIVFQGLLGDDAGAMFRFSYDQAPCGNPGGCRPRFVIERCDRPTLVIEGYGGPTFICKAVTDPGR